MSKSKWTGIVVDVETVGPIPGDYSMIEIGAVVLKRNHILDTFHMPIAPINDNYKKEACDSIGIDFGNIKQTYKISPWHAMGAFKFWIERNTDKGTYPMFISDNNGFDFMFTHWYFIHYLHEDPFGHTSRNIADIFGGLNKDMSKAFDYKKLRDTKHTHRAVDDALGNVEALIKIIDQYGLEGFNIDGQEEKRY